MDDEKYSPDKKVVFIAHRVAGVEGEAEKNITNALRWAKWALRERKVNPLVPYAYFCIFLDDSKSTERKLGVECTFQMIKRCDELWICGPRPPAGSHVWNEVAEAEKYSRKIIDLTDLILPPEYRADFA